jgi:hypothetical protein
MLARILSAHVKSHLVQRILMTTIHIYYYIYFHICLEYKSLVFTGMKNHKLSLNCSRLGAIPVHFPFISTNSIKYTVMFF